MKRFFRHVEEALADAALLEMGVGVAGSDYDSERESLEENLIEVAFAEEADFEDIHVDILREHCEAWKRSHPDDLCVV